MYILEHSCRTPDSFLVPNYSLVWGWWSIRRGPVLCMRRGVTRRGGGATDRGNRFQRNRQVMATLLGQIGDTDIIMMTDITDIIMMTLETWGTLLWQKEDQTNTNRDNQSNCYWHIRGTTLAHYFIHFDFSLLEIFLLFLATDWGRMCRNDDGS